MDNYAWSVDRCLQSEIGTPKPHNNSSNLPKTLVKDDHTAPTLHAT